MEKILNGLHTLRNINSAYNLDNITIDNLFSEIETAKVCTPIIGKFSSGKSALTNALLGNSCRLLKEDITPETALPTEIVYSNTEDIVTLYNNDGTNTEVDIFDYRSMELDANTTKCARIHLNNSFLEEIPDVMLVDMPGFESGFEVHNKAIDNYLPQSLAYIVAFPADDMIVRSSVGNILKELCLHDIPICVVITKYDKRNDEFDETLAKLKESLKRFVGSKELSYCITSSAQGEVSELRDFLFDIQRKSKDILAGKFKNDLLSVMNTTETYLLTTLKNNELSESELAEREEQLSKQLNDLTTKFSKEKEEFELQISECIEEIKADVQTALNAEEQTLVTMAVNKQDTSDHINTIVRNAVTASIQRRLIPKLEKHLKKVSTCINGDNIGDVHVSFNVDIENVNKGITASVVAATAGLVVALPILGLVAAGVTLLVSKLTGDKKREEAKEEARIKLRSEVFPQILNEVGKGAELAIVKQLTIINTSIEDDIKTQKDTLEKAMADVRGRINDENSRKANLAIDIKEDLERIGEIRNGI